MLFELQIFIFNL